LGGIFGGGSARSAGRTIGAAGTAGAQAIGTAGNQAAGATNQATQQGLGLYGQAIQGIQGATQQGQQGVFGAGQQAIAQMYGARDQSNQVAGNLLGGQLENLSPYLQSGAQGTAGAAALAAQGFHAPTAAEAEATPGYQFQLQQGLQGVEQQLGATGGGATGGALKALTQYGQGVASTYYQNAFNNALQGYNTNLNANLSLAQQGLSASGMADQAAQNFGNIYNSNTMGAAQYAGNVGVGTAEYGANLGMQGAGTEANLLSGEAGFGLQGAVTAGNQNLAGTEAASQMFMQGAQGTAAGQMGQANAWSNAFSGIGSAAMAGLPPTYGGYNYGAGGVNPYGGGGGAPWWETPGASGPAVPPQTWGAINYGPA
jgi:hypothetical protein